MNHDIIIYIYNIYDYIYAHGGVCDHMYVYIYVYLIFGISLLHAHPSILHTTFRHLGSGPFNLAMWMLRKNCQ